LQPWILPFCGRVTLDIKRSRYMELQASVDGLYVISRAAKS
jgi:hypothetical protein